MKKLHKVLHILFYKSILYTTAILYPLTALSLTSHDTSEIHYEYTPQQKPPQTKDRNTSSQTEQHSEKSAVFKNPAHLLKNISKNLKICKHCKKEGIQIKRTRVYFDVMPDSTIRVTHIDPTTGCKTQDQYIKEAFKTIEVTSPATLNGKPIKTSYSIPINFL